MDRRFSAAAERNQGPILEVLRRVLPARGTVLEVASGTGQHAACFAAALPALEWQPSEPTAEGRASIAAWVAGLTNVRAPLDLDVTRRPWPVGPVDALYCANMIHIAPWEACEALFAGAAEVVRPGGVVVLYGPFKLGGTHTAPSNAAFDADLRARDPRWGVRDLDDVVAVAPGFTREERVPMPANNQVVVFRRG